MKHKDIRFKTRRIKDKDTMEQNYSEISKEPDKTNSEDLPDYIQPFTHLFNKKKFEKLPERCEWDHEINLTEEAPKKLNAKAYTMTVKKEEALNQWLDKQLKAGLIVESKSRYTAVKIVDGGLCFYFFFFLNFILFYFIFLFLEQLGLGFISHAVTSVTN